MAEEMKESVEEMVKSGKLKVYDVVLSVQFQGHGISDIHVNVAAPDEQSAVGQITEMLRNNKKLLGLHYIEKQEEAKSLKKPVILDTERAEVIFIDSAILSYDASAKSVTDEARSS